MASFSPHRGSHNTLVTLSGSSLYSVSGVYLVSGATGALATLVSTSTNQITFYPPRLPPSGIRSGNWSIYNRFGSVTTTDYHIVIETPFVSGINPNSGFSGSYFRISGSGVRDLTGLWFNDLYTGVLTDPIFENSTWLRSGQVPFVSGGLNSYFAVKGMSEGGSSVSPQLFYVRDQGLSLSGISEFPTPIQAENLLRGNSTASALEWVTPGQVLSSISGMSGIFREQIVFTAATGSGVNIRIPNGRIFSADSRLTVYMNGMAQQQNSSAGNWDSDYGVVGNTGIFMSYPVPTGSRLKFEIFN